MAKEVVMLHDVSRCSGCRACMVACKQWHDLPADMSTEFEGEYQSHKDLTSTTYNLVKFNERLDSKGKFHWDIIKYQCMHCAVPGCAEGCPKHAITKLEHVPVVINEDLCVGCDYCSMNCPFGIPKLDEKKHKSTKCDMCYDRISEGMMPSCAKTCTAQAIDFGYKDKMLEIANKRLAELKAEGHEDACLYGTDGENLTANMIYVLPEKPSVYGLPEQPKVSDGMYLWRDVIKPIGKLASGGALLGLAGMMIVHSMVKSQDEEKNTDEKGDHIKDEADKE